MLRELSFFTGRGVYACDHRSPIFSGPPLSMRKKFWSPLCLCKKILVPPSVTLKKFWSPPLTHIKKWSPPFDYPQKFWSPPPQTDGPPPGKNDSSLSCISSCLTNLHMYSAQKKKLKNLSIKDLQINISEFFLHIRPLLI